LFVAGVFWWNFGVLVGCARNLKVASKKNEKPEKVVVCWISFMHRNWPK
jgi:hypothetical protein